MSDSAHKEYQVHRRSEGTTFAIADRVAEEVPVALVYNGISHTVMLATPQDLEDFALGHSLSEGIVGQRSEIYDLETTAHPAGITVHLRIAEPRFQQLKTRRRTLAGRTGCGLCGIESLEQMRPPCAPRVTPGGHVAAGALQRAQAQLLAQQPLFAATGAAHAAAWCDFDGQLRLMREDIGRHNALDKLIGALMARSKAFDAGFVLLTSRASYEMVSKAAAVGMPIVAAVSAPTGLAVRIAKEAGVTLIGFARGNNCNVYSHFDRVH